jgi:hypothetical protein
VAPSYGAAKDVAWGLFKEYFADFHRYRLIDKVVESDLLIRLKTGSVVQLKGADKPDSLRGVKLSRVVLDEYATMKSETWEEVLQPATSDLRAPVIFIGTPQGFNHFHELAEMETKKDNAGNLIHPDWRTFTVKASEAGTIEPEELARAQRDMDPRVYRQEYEASFVSFGGQVFTDYDESRHVPVDAIKFNPEMEYCLGMDFGWSAPSVALFINVDAQENVYVWHELARRETPIPIIGKLIKDATPGYAPRLIACDPAGDAKNEALGTSSVQELRAIFGWERVRYRAKYPGVIQDRVNLIRRWLRNGKFYVSKDCVNLRSALRSYRYPNPKDEVQSELPLKDGISDHWIDALGEFFINRFPLRSSTVGVM